MGEESTVLKIDRTRPFEVSTGYPWRPENVWIQDKRSLALAEVDLTKVFLVTCHRRGERSLYGNEWFGRLENSPRYISLDAMILQTFWESPHLIPEGWKEKVNVDGYWYTRNIYFPGTVLRDHHYGLKYILYLCWTGEKWSMDERYLNEMNWQPYDLSAVLPAPPRGFWRFWK